MYEITGLGDFFNIAELQNAGSSKEVEGGTPRGGRAHCAWNAHPLNAHQEGGGSRVRHFGNSDCVGGTVMVDLPIIP